MSLRAKRELLNRTLNSHLNNIHETFQVLDETPPASLDKVSWNEVIQMGEQVSKQATMIGMLCSGETPEIAALEGNMAAYFNMLQGFLLLSHGSIGGAGPTLSSSVHAAVKLVVDSSFQLLRESVSSYGSRNTDQKLSIPQLVGAVWDACSALKKTPATNITAIGRAITQVAVSIKDVLREMKELKPASSDPTDETSQRASKKTESIPENDENSSEGDLGNDLSPEEMKLASSVIAVVAELLTVIKELIRCITSLIKQEDANKSSSFVDSLEKLLMLCKEIGMQVDEVGACLYPPQEVPAMKAAVDKISGRVDELQTEVENLGGTSETFIQACYVLRGAMGQLNSMLADSSIPELVPEMQNLSVSN